MRIDKRLIFEIHRLKDLGWSQRRIATHLAVSRDVVRKYLTTPDLTRTKRGPCPTKLDPYRDLIDRFLVEDPEVKAPVVLQRLESQGFDGKITIVRTYLQKLRGSNKSRKAFIRFESQPGQQLQIDWGHFGHLVYGDSKRKLYLFAAIESYSRMIYAEFTHSQKQASLHQCLLNAFSYLGGTPEQIVVDNMMTAVCERQGNLVRFNDAFLDFLRIFKIVPRACNARAPHEKGKVENSIKYVRYNFLPLRSFADLTDANTQLTNWLNSVANVRVHQGIGQRPIDRFGTFRLRLLPELLPDCRETVPAKVYKDFSIRFDDNSYTTPPWAIGKQVIVKAESFAVTIYLKNKTVATHKRCWERKQRIELPAHVEQVKKLHRKLWEDKQVAAFASIGQAAIEYLNALAAAKQPIRKSVTKLLLLKDEYGVASIMYALQKALFHRAYGADYIENILYQEMTPQRQHPPVKLKKEKYNNIRLPEPLLADYDAHAVKKRNK